MWLVYGDVVGLRRRWLCGGVVNVELEFDERGDHRAVGLFNDGGAGALFGCDPADAADDLFDSVRSANGGGVGFQLARSAYQSLAITEQTHQFDVQPIDARANLGEILWLLGEILWLLGEILWLPARPAHRLGDDYLLTIEGERWPGMQLIARRERLADRRQKLSSSGPVKTR